MYVQEAIGDFGPPEPHARHRQGLSYPSRTVFSKPVQRFGTRTLTAIMRKTGTEKAARLSPH